MQAGRVLSSESFFASRRERRLWLWTLAVVAATYSTIGLAGTLAGAVSEDVLGGGFFICLLLVMAIIVTQGLRTKPGRAEFGLALGIVVVYFLMFARMNMSPAERTHLLEYCVVGVLIYEALKERARQGRRIPVPALLAILVTSMVGVLDESIQAFVPGRVFDPIDILQNFLGGVTAVTTMVTMGWVRGWFRKANSD